MRALSRSLAIPLLVTTSLVGCSDEPASAPGASNADSQVLSLDGDRLDGRTVVARVNGQPVSSECVEIQGRAHQLTAREALDECIDFELLAQAARERGYLDHDAVQDAGKREMVRRFVLAEYPLRDPDEIPDELVARLWEAERTRRYNNPELRGIVFCRIPLAAELPDSDPAVQAARRFFDGIHARLRDRRDLRKEELFAPCYEEYQAAGIEKLKLHTFAVQPRDGYIESFAQPVFSLDGIGQLAPPFRSNFGYELVLLESIVPPRSTTFEEAEPELREALFSRPEFEPQRRARFASWMKPLMDRSQIEILDSRIPSSQQGLSIQDDGPN